MPTYDYQCTKCNARFEVFHAMGDTQPRQCPKCGKSAKRLISAGVGIIVKGGSSAFNCSGEKCGSDPEQCRAEGTCQGCCVDDL